VPSSPPPSDPYGEALGLNLLALALRLDHVDRLSDSLHLVDSTHMRRSVAVDINLASLTDAQRRTLRSVPHDSAARPKTIWLPLGRHARQDLAPIQVRDAGGSVLTTLTQRATVWALGLGLRRAFMIWLDSNPDAHKPDHPLQELRHNQYRSSWLIEAAMTNLIDNGSSPEQKKQRQNWFWHWLQREPERARERAPQISGAAEAGSSKIRKIAEGAIQQLFESPDNPLLSLLEMVSSEHLLVVEVDTEHDHAFLRYDAPVLPALESVTHGSRQARRRWRPPSWASLEHEFTITYATVIPRAVNSYHATVEVSEELRVRRLLMISDNDAHPVRLLVGDLRALAAQYEVLKRTAPAVLELELEAIVSRAAEIGRRRHRDLRAYQAYLASCYLTFTHRAPLFRNPPAQPASAEELCAEIGQGQRLVERLRQLADMLETTGNLKDLTKKLDEARLKEWAAQFVTAELERDVYVDNDPRESAGHSHWSRRAFGSSLQSAEPVKATVYATLVDDPPSLAASVGRLLFAVVALVVALSALLGIGPSDLYGALRGAPPAINAGDPTPLGTADALVTILLLVPGLLLSRLDIPSHRTVLGRLRLFSRYVAYGAVSVSAVLALAVSTRSARELAVPVAIALVLLAIVVVFVLVDGTIKAYKRRSRVPNKTAIPRWLIDEIRSSPRRRRRRTAAEFSTVSRSSLV